MVVIIAAIVENSDGSQSTQPSATSQPSTTDSSMLSVPQGGDLTVNDMGTTKTIACQDGNLTLAVDSGSMTVIVTGHCVQLTVSGSSNHVTVDSADYIDANGTDNVVIYHSGSPKITDSGTGNTIQHG